MEKKAEQLLPFDVDVEKKTKDNITTEKQKGSRDKMIENWD